MIRCAGRGTSDRTSRTMPDARAAAAAAICVFLKDMVKQADITSTDYSCSRPVICRAAVCVCLSKSSSI